MTTDPQESTLYAPGTGVAPHHTAASPAQRPSESLPEQRSPATLISFPARSKQSPLPAPLGLTTMPLFLLLLLVVILAGYVLTAELVKQRFYSGNELRGEAYASVQ